MFEIYKKLKQGKEIHVLALNNKIGNGRYIPFIDIDHATWNQIRAYVHNASIHFGEALVMRTANGYHLYYPQEIFDTLENVVCMINDYFGGLVEPEYNEVAMERGYHSLRVSKYSDNCVEVHKKIPGYTTIVGEVLSKFICTVVNMYGDEQI